MPSAPQIMQLQQQQQIGQSIGGPQIGPSGNAIGPPPGQFHPTGSDPQDQQTHPPHQVGILYIRKTKS